MKIFMSNPFEIEDFSFEGNLISSMNYFRYFKPEFKIKNAFLHGYSGNNLNAFFYSPNFLQKLYLDKDKRYFAFLNEFKERYFNYDVIVMNPGWDLVHPEFLYKNFSNSIKCLHFIDDPHLSYGYGSAFSWIFDCATYISPSYNEDFTMEEILSLFGFKKFMWVPHSISCFGKSLLSKEEFFNQQISRNDKCIYVGNFYLSKAERLLKIKNELKNSYDYFGKAPLKGFIYPLLNLRNNKLSFTTKSRPIDNFTRDKLYSTYGIGLNMHLSTPSLECGNARTYELAYNGLAQVCDKSEVSLSNFIFQDKKEIFFYSNINECKDVIKYLIYNKEVRYEVAYNAYTRCHKEYQYYNVLRKQISWFNQLL